MTPLAGDQFAQFVGAELIEIGGQVMADMMPPASRPTIVDFPNGGPSQNPDHAAIGQPFPG
jgi:hypothetical protein